MPVMRDVSGLAAAILGTEAIGAASGLAAGGGFKEYYERLRKPPLTPPASVFGPTWTVLYLLMGVATWLVWRKGPSRQVRIALGVSAAQLTLNFAWSLIFFGRRRVGVALLENAVLWLTVLATIVAFWRVRRVAGVILLPYFAWVSFAAYLNAGIWRLN